MARCREEKGVANVIVGTFTIYSHPYFALIYVSSTHSYVASFVLGNLGILVEETFSEVSVVSPLRQLVRVNKFCSRHLLEIQGFIFSVDLME